MDGSYDGRTIVAGADTAEADMQRERACDEK
jgi:hypothetical protein